MRVDKFLSECGYTRKQADNLIKSKRVKLNNVIINKKDTKINENIDKIYVDDEKCEYKKFVYIMLNKPSGILSATEDKTQKTVISLLPEKLQKQSLFPVGRLDKETVGLLILTNDGDYCHRMISPKRNISKKYYFELADEFYDDEIKKIENGIQLKDGYNTLPCKVEKTSSKSGYITITEGKYHQIRRMFGAIGNKVVFLERIQEGKLKLDKNLARGEWRYLETKEIE